MFFVEDYRDQPDHKLFKWIGREIEYKDCENLRWSQRVFRGRVVKIHPHNYVTVQVSHITSFPIRTVSSRRRFRSKPKKAGKKFPWKEISEKEFHLVRLDPRQKRWKMIESQHKNNFKTEIRHISPYYNKLKDIVNEFRSNYLSSLYYRKVTE